MQRGVRVTTSWAGLRKTVVFLWYSSIHARRPEADVPASHRVSHFYCLLPQTLERGRLQFFHQGFDPTCSIDQFCSGNDVLCPSIFHLGQKSQCSNFCVCYTSQEEHQSDSVLTMLTCVFREIYRLSWVFCFVFFLHLLSISQTQDDLKLK